MRTRQVFSIKKQFSRREASKTVGAAGTLAIIERGTPVTAEAALMIRSAPSVMTLSTVSARTVRISIQSLRDGQPEPTFDDGALVEGGRGSVLAQFHGLPAPRTLRSGELKVLISAAPITLRIDSGEGKLVQDLRVDEASGELSFALGGAPLLGLGQGGPQFDRRGHADATVSGQGGYQLGTHGARLPIQWLIVIHVRMMNSSQTQSIEFKGEPVSVSF